MITGITIENFKGIRDRVHVDFRPITLLFGANITGKTHTQPCLHLHKPSCALQRVERLQQQKLDEK